MDTLEGWTKLAEAMMESMPVFVIQKLLDNVSLGAGDFTVFVHRNRSNSLELRVKSLHPENRADDVHDAAEKVAEYLRAAGLKCNAVRNTRQGTYIHLPKETVEALSALIPVDMERMRAGFESLKSRADVDLAADPRVVKNIRGAQGFAHAMMVHEEDVALEDRVSKYVDQLPPVVFADGEKQASLESLNGGLQDCPDEYKLKLADLDLEEPERLKRRLRYAIASKQDVKSDEDGYTDRWGAFQREGKAYTEQLMAERRDGNDDRAKS